MNKVLLQGNLGNEPTLNFTAAGTPVATLHMATNEQFTTAAGEKKQRADWHRVVVWGKRAEACKKYLTTGRQVTVEGKLQTRSYKDKDGVTRWVSEVVASSVDFGRRSSNNQEQQKQQQDLPLPAEAPLNEDEAKDMAHEAMVGNIPF